MPTVKKTKKKIAQPIDVDDDGPLRKGWAVGDRGVLLEGFLNPYVNGRRVSRDKARLVGDEAANKYLDKYPRRAPGDKATIEKWTKKMRKGVHRWLEHRAKKADRTPSRKQQVHDPIYKILTKVAGLKPPRQRARTAEQLWAKAHFDEHREEFDSVFESSGSSKKERPAAYQRFIKQCFEDLPDDEQEGFQAAAVAEAKSLKKARKENGPEITMLSPEETQVAIDRIPAVLGPLMDGICELLGMHGSIVFAGPEPRKGGQLNACYMHIGENKAAIPRAFDLAGKGRYKAFTTAYLSFIEECYDREERLARSLPPEQLEPKYLNWAVKKGKGKRDKGGGESEEEGESSDDDSGSSSDSASSSSSSDSGSDSDSDSGSESDSESEEDSSDSDSSVAKQPKTRKRKHGGRRLGSEDESAAEEDAPPSRKKVKRTATKDSGGTEAAKKVSRAKKVVSTKAKKVSGVAKGSKVAESSKGKKSVGGGRVNKPESEAEGGGPRRSKRTAAAEEDASPKKRQKTNGEEAAAAPPAKEKDGSDAPDDSEDQVDEATRLEGGGADPDASIDPRLLGLENGVPVLGPADAPDPFSKSIFYHPSATGRAEGEVSSRAEEDTAIVENDSVWPDWFRDAKSYLEGVGGGEEWARMLRLWTIVEGRADFANDAGSRLGKGSRPEAVGYWVRCGRRKDPAISDMKTFASEWWAWWEGLQPRWRQKNRKGKRKYSAQDRYESKGDWSDLRKPGVNGFYSVLAALAWWGRALALEKSSEKRRRDWMEAMMDVEWVLRSMLEE